MKRTIIAGLTGLSLTVLALPSLPAYAGDATAGSVTAASQGSATALGRIVQGSAEIIQGSAEFAVVSVATVADGTVTVLRSASTGAEVSMRISGQGLQDFSRWTGKTLKVVATSAGTILANGSKVVLFIPTATAEALFHAATYRGQ